MLTNRNFNSCRVSLREMMRLHMLVQCFKLTTRKHVILDYLEILFRLFVRVHVYVCAYVCFTRYVV